jgi:hypothetical protein
MLLTVKSYLFILINLDNPAILDDQRYRAEANGPQRIPYLSFQFSVPWLNFRGSH